jgi:MarR family transcriptional regulator, 2-MHQ and catechol-resistance regulon repressor
MTLLYQELKKKRPFASLEEEGTLNMLRTADQVQIRFTRLFRDFGLTQSQYNVLRILRGEGKPLPILEIAERTVTVVPGITGLIDRLEKAGLVRRERCPDDRRVIFVCLTDKAGKVLARVDAPLLALNQQLMNPLTPAEVKELVRLLEKVREPLGG